MTSITPSDNCILLYSNNGFHTKVGRVDMAKMCYLDITDIDKISVPFSGFIVREFVRMLTGQYLKMQADRPDDQIEFIRMCKYMNLKEPYRQTLIISFVKHNEEGDPYEEYDLLYRSRYFVEGSRFECAQFDEIIRMIRTQPYWKNPNKN